MVGQVVAGEQQGAVGVARQVGERHRDGAAGAIASSAVPGAMGIGALAGAAFGSVNEVLKGHGVSDEDAEYYSPRMKDGAVFMSVE